MMIFWMYFLNMGSLVYTHGRVGSEAHPETTDEMPISLPLWIRTPGGLRAVINDSKSVIDRLVILTDMTLSYFLAERTVDNILVH